MLRILNTLTKRVEEVSTLEPGVARMYTCGPTVYRYAHIGNLRTYLMADCLRRVLECGGYEVVHVKNITDVGHMRMEMLESGGDKVVTAALAEGKTPQEIAQYYTSAFHRDEERLNILPAHHHPRATGHIHEMIAMIERLFEKGYAYQSGGNVYFDVSKFADYGKLSGNLQQGLMEGVRAEVDPLKSKPTGLHPLESGGTWPRHEVGQPMGRRIPGVAHRVLRYVHQVHGGAAGHTHRRSGQHLPPSRR